MKERKKDLLIAAVLCFAVMFLIPTVLVQVLEGTNSTLAAFIMWYAMFPCFAVGLGWWAGWDVRHRWLSVILCGLFYMLGDLITYGKFDRMLLLEMRRMRKVGCTVVVSARLNSRMVDVLIAMRRMGPYLRLYLITFDPSDETKLPLINKLQSSGIEVCYVTPAAL